MPSAIELVVRDLRSGETEPQSFGSEEEACAWLRARPAFIDVLGATHELSQQTVARLREAMRSFDEDEQREAEALRARDAEMEEARRQIEQGRVAWLHAREPLASPSARRLTGDDGQRGCVKRCV